MQIEPEITLRHVELTEADEELIREGIADLAGLRKGGRLGRSRQVRMEWTGTGSVTQHAIRCYRYLADSASLRRMNCMIETVRSMTAADRAANRNWFSQETNGAVVVTRALVDMHEHLGQSIAYARTNQIVAPWNR